MRRNFALVTSARHGHDHVTRPVTCLGFVVLLSLAFWAGAIWIAEFLIRLSQLGY